MKKPKRPMGWEENDEASFEEGGSEMNEMLDEEIIDLEDIVELPEGELDEDDDRMDVDVEVLDLDSDLDLGEERGGSERHKKGISGRDLDDESALSSEEYVMSDLDQDRDSLDDETDELLRDFAFADEEGEKSHAVDELDLLSGESDEDSMDPSLPGGSRDESDLLGDDHLFDEAMEDELRDFSFPDDEKDIRPRESLDLLEDVDKETDAGLPDVSISGEKSDKPEVKRTASGPAEGQDLKDLDLLLSVAKDAPTDKKVQTKVDIVEEAEKSDSGLPVDAPGVNLAPLDELVSRIESRLMESVRQIVEARLPDVVRVVLREEIDKIKKEMG